jgi:hypothetical protein
MDTGTLKELARKIEHIAKDWRWDRGKYPEHQGVSAVINGRTVDLTDSFHMTTGDRHSEIYLGQFIAAANPTAILALISSHEAAERDAALNKAEWDAAETARTTADLMLREERTQREAAEERVKALVEALTDLCKTNFYNPKNHELIYQRVEKARAALSAASGGR